MITVLGERPPKARAARRRRSGRLCKPGWLERAAWRETRLYLAERDGRQCFYCRAPFDTLKGATIDHYVPKSLWRCNLPTNLVLACSPCNLRKGDRLTGVMAAVLLAHFGESWRSASAGAGRPAAA